MQFHSAAAMFPMLGEDEFSALVEDIRVHGLVEPIWTFENRILDGRNRYKACTVAGVKPSYRVWKGADPFAFVVSENLRRRHLDAGQRAAIAVKSVLPRFEREAKERMRQGGKGVPTLAPLTKARDQAAAMFQVAHGYISDAKRVQAADPALLDRIICGDLLLLDALRLLKEQTREHKRARNRALVEDSESAEKIEGPFPTVVIDPPWDWGDEGDIDQFGRGRPTYATMPLEEIEKQPVSDLAEANAHIYLWITNRSLPKGFSLLEAWGFRYVTALTWCKPSIGMGNYFRGSTEHVLFGVRGSLELLARDVGTWFAAPRAAEHSGKPSEFYELVEHCSPGPWLEMFARGNARPGWKQWGAEVSA